MTTDFSEWLAREMPAGTVIGNPLWWASKIVDYRARALLDQPELTDDKLMDIACATDLVYCMGEGYGFASRYQEEADITAEVLAFARAVIAADRARAALAQPEPVAPTDKKWEWYGCCPEDGIELHSSKELAHKAAQEVMGFYSEAAHSDGWHEDMESVSWGMLLPVEQAQVVERTEAEPDSEFDEWIRYELVPARWGTPVNNTRGTH
jgi:hypothetical protein